jgi:hypothetical protein
MVLNFFTFFLLSFFVEKKVGWCILVVLFWNRFCYLEFSKFCVCVARRFACTVQESAPILLLNDEETICLFPYYQVGKDLCLRGDTSRLGALTPCGAKWRCKHIWFLWCLIALSEPADSSES